MPQSSSIGDSREFFAQLLGAVSQPIFAVDTDERVTYWNEAAARQYGYSQDQTLGRPFTETIARGNVEAARLILDTVWRGDNWSGEFLVTGLNGVAMAASFRFAPIFDSFQRITAVSAVSEPGSCAPVRPAFDPAARASRSSLDAIWELDLATGALSGNDAYHRLIGPTPAGETAREAWLARIHPADLPEIRAEAFGGEDGRSTFRREYRLLDFQSNTYIRILDHGIFIRDAEGTILRVAGAMRDISNRYDMQQAARTTADRFRLAFEESPIGILLLNRNFQVMQTNRAFRRLMGYSAEALAGRSILDFTHRDDLPKCTKLANELFASNSGFFRIEKRYLRADGEIVWAAITATALIGRDGSPPLGLALIEDVTRQKRDQEELSAANARAEAAMNAKMRFLAQISHEIRSPMNGVLGMLELLDGSPLLPEQQANLNSARQAATSLLGMLEEILDLTRLDEQRLSLHARGYSPRQLLSDLASLYHPVLGSRKIGFTTTVLPGVPDEHVADPARVRQILVNLLENAVKFTAQGHITVTLLTIGSALCFAVEDSGIGIPSDALDSIFEAFSPASAMTSASVGGTGLGLAISQRLARLMGGDITVSSTVGAGSRFTLSLPLAAGSSPVTSPSIPISPIICFPGRRVLVVEDNPINQRVAVGILRRLNCEVDLAANGVEGLERALAIRYDAVFMDAMMPVMDGFEATAELRRREDPGRRVPVIGLTALATEEDRMRCLAAGMDDYLSKPTDSLAIGAALQRWLPAFESSLQ